MVALVHVLVVDGGDDASGVPSHLGGGLVVVRLRGGLHVGSNAEQARQHQDHEGNHHHGQSDVDVDEDSHRDDKAEQGFDDSHQGLGGTSQQHAVAADQPNQLGLVEGHGVGQGVERGQTLDGFVGTAFMQRSAQGPCRAGRGVVGECADGGDASERGAEGAQHEDLVVVDQVGQPVPVGVLDGVQCEGDEADDAALRSRGDGAEDADGSDSLPVGTEVRSGHPPVRRHEASGALSQPS